FVGSLLALCWLFVGSLLALCWLFISTFVPIKVYQVCNSFNSLLSNVPIYYWPFYYSKSAKEIGVYGL
ncbi:MAG: hypothetical protein CMO01_29415, partial [Thalassobius sp.]|nr:hypothetical protein [Thalassovita sp.]